MPIGHPSTAETSCVGTRDGIQWRSSRWHGKISVQLCNTVSSLVCLCERYTTHSCTAPLRLREWVQPWISCRLARLEQHWTEWKRRGRDRKHMRWRWKGRESHIYVSSQQPRPEPPWASFMYLLEDNWMLDNLINPRPPLQPLCYWDISMPSKIQVMQTWLESLSDPSLDFGNSPGLSNVRAVQIESTLEGW